jgi:hypothetical protein
MIKLKGVKLTMANLEKVVKAKQKQARESEMRKVLHGLKEDTPVDTGEARDGWVIVGDAIENPVEHIVPLNEGTSKQAPAHFIERRILQNPKLIVTGAIVRNK